MSANKEILDLLDTLTSVVAEIRQAEDTCHSLISSMESTMYPDSEYLAQLKGEAIAYEVAAIKIDAAIRNAKETINGSEMLKILNTLIRKGLTSQEKQFILESQNYAEYQWQFNNCPAGLHSIIKSEEEYELLKRMIS